MKTGDQQDTGVMDGELEGHMPERETTAGKWDVECVSMRRLRCRIRQVLTQEPHSGQRGPHVQTLKVGACLGGLGKSQEARVVGAGE